MEEKVVLMERIFLMWGINFESKLIHGNYSKFIIKCR
jgi:hypothetical protein